MRATESPEILISPSSRRHFTFISIGNTTNDGEWNYTWQAGRQLRSMLKPMSASEYQACEPGEDGDAKLEIVLSGSNVLTGTNTQVTLTAKVRQGGSEITSTIPAANFNWTRDSGDETADTVWNNAHSGMKAVTVSQLSGTAKFFCTMSPVANYGEFYPDVENGMLVMKHTQGAVNDTFSIVDGVLKATADDYGLDYPMVKVESNTIACTLTSSMFVYTAVPTQGYRFTYNSDGLRVKKEYVKGGLVLETTDYTLHGKLITEMRKGQDVLHFFYDAQGRASMVEWNGEMYSYVHNLQGDIVTATSSNYKTVKDISMRLRCD